METINWTLLISGACKGAAHLLSRGLHASSEASWVYQGIGSNSSPTTNMLCQLGQMISLPLSLSFFLLFNIHFFYLVNDCRFFNIEENSYDMLTEKQARKSMKKFLKQI